MGFTGMFGEEERFCIDYRRVNAVSKKDAYPIPDIQDALDNLRGSRYFATIDLLSGYWQLGMTDRGKSDLFFVLAAVCFISHACRLACQVRPDHSVALCP